MESYCNEYGTIYVISSDFGDHMTTQSMGLMVLLSEYFYIPGMKYKGHAKQNTKKELKETLNDNAINGMKKVHPMVVGSSDALASVQV